MKVKMNTAKEVVKSIDLRVSPIEFMIIKDALYDVNRLGISMPDAKPSGIAEGGCNAVLLAHGKGYLMTDCLGVRDAAMRADARGCIPFIMENGRIRSPYYDSAGVEYPDLTGLAEEMGMEDGDAAVVCGADTEQEAYVAAFASMIKLLKPLMRNV